MKFPKAPVLQNRKLAKHKKGLHQGAPLSPILLNLHLTKFDNYCEELNPNFYRFMDDMTFFFHTEKEAKELFCYIQNYLDWNYDIDLNPKKTAIKPISELGFLGYQFNSQNLLVPTKENVISFVRNINRCINIWQNSQDTDELVFQMNKKLRGWASFYQLAEVGPYLDKIDGWIRQKLLITIFQRCLNTQSRHRVLHRLLRSKRAADKLYLLSNDELERLGNRDMKYLFSGSGIVSVRNEINRYSLMSYGIS